MVTEELLLQYFPLLKYSLRGEKKNSKNQLNKKNKKNNCKNQTVKKNKLKFLKNRPVRFYKPETKKTEPNRTQTRKKPRRSV
jgi:hypothetical protein